MFKKTESKRKIFRICKKERKCETGNTRFNCDLHQLRIIAEILNLIARPLTPESIATKVTKS